MKLLVDMNLSPRWSDVLERYGFEAVHWSAVGELNAPDSEIMAWAVANGWVVLTTDMDFSAILAASQGQSPSVVQIRTEDVSPDTVGVRIANAIRQIEADLKEGAILSINDRSARLRLLPIVKTSKK
jgi:predicted nuclease of predicted toxin-antitoxin system